MNHVAEEEVTVLLNVWAGDDPRSLEQSLQSVFRQIGVKVSLFIISDGPITNDLREVISQYERLTNPLFLVTLVINPQQKGLWHARTAGLEMCKSELVALQDADDVMHPRRLVTQLTQQRILNCDVLGSSIAEFDSITENILGFRVATTDSESIRRKLKFTNPISHSSVLMRRQAVLDMGGYRNVYLAEDYDLWIRMASADYRLSNLSNVLLGFRRDQKFFSRRGGRQFLRSELDLWRQLNQTHHFSKTVGVSSFTLRSLYRIGPSSLRRMVHEYQLTHNLLGSNVSTLTSFLELEVT